VGVSVLNDASDLNVRQRERLGQILQSPRLDPLDLAHPFDERDLNVGVLAPLLGQNFDAAVVIFAKLIVVAVNLAV
jgi:hypothetical protein